MVCLTLRQKDWQAFFRKNLQKTFPTGERPLQGGPPKEQTCIVRRISQVKWTAGAAHDFSWLTLCPGDIDYYSIPLARGDQLGVNIDADPF